MDYRLEFLRQCVQAAYNLPEPQRSDRLEMLDRIEKRTAPPIYYDSPD